MVDVSAGEISGGTADATASTTSRESVGGPADDTAVTTSEARVDAITDTAATGPTADANSGPSSDAESSVTGPAVEGAGEKGASWSSPVDVFFEPSGEDEVARDSTDSAHACDDDDDDDSFSTIGS